jgi:hypothetical protein
LLACEADEDVVQRRLRDGIVDHVTDAPGRFHADEHGGHGEGTRIGRATLDGSGDAPAGGHRAAPSALVPAPHLPNPSGTSRGTCH